MDPEFFPKDESLIIRKIFFIVGIIKQKPYGDNIWKAGVSKSRSCPFL